MTERVRRTLGDDVPVGLFFSSVQWGFRRDERLWNAAFHELYRRGKVVPQVPLGGFTAGVIFHWWGSGEWPEEDMPRFDAAGLAMKRFSWTRGWEAHVMVPEPEPGQTRWAAICTSLLSAISAISAMEADAARRGLPESVTDVLRTARSLCEPEPHLEP
jgi:hypothetical protein